MFEEETEVTAKQVILEPIKEGSVSVRESVGDTQGGQIDKSVYLLYAKALSYKWMISFLILLGLRYGLIVRTSTHSSFLLLLGIEQYLVGHVVR